MGEIGSPDIKSVGDEINAATSVSAACSASSGAIRIPRPPSAHTHTAPTSVQPADGSRREPFLLLLALYSPTPLLPTGRAGVS